MSKYILAFKNDTSVDSERDPGWVKTLVALMATHTETEQRRPFVSISKTTQDKGNATSSHRGPEREGTAPEPRVEKWWRRTR